MMSIRTGSCCSARLPAAATSRRLWERSIRGSPFARRASGGRHDLPVREIDHEIYFYRPLENTAQSLGNLLRQMFFEPIFRVGMPYPDDELTIFIRHQFSPFEPRVKRGAIELELELAECGLPGVFWGQHQKLASKNVERDNNSIPQESSETLLQKILDCLFWSMMVTAGMVELPNRVAHAV